MGKDPGFSCQSNALPPDIYRISIPIEGGNLSNYFSSQTIFKKIKHQNYYPISHYFLIPLL